ncbi:hypothetical protein LAZ67_5003941 [Cordylochernes scorpioides]|uniref:Uncharacterized protein n=1 Tax=Cordylochernes scorpioides TaxID=51811 RepID=A0ABY6KHM6_9ARAC|nr:hypothetical protein LAZ67_5003941 [Cordylochernes scorpioides]
MWWWPLREMIHLDGNTGIVSMKVQLDKIIPWIKMKISGLPGDRFCAENMYENIYVCFPT